MINKQRLIATLLELVAIDSPSSYEEKIAQVLREKLSIVGAKTYIDHYGNVIGTFLGKGKPFMLNAHMDTVQPGESIKPIVQADMITTDGKTVLGGDPKAGIAVILESITALQEEKIVLPALEIIFTREEEIGLLGAKKLDFSQIHAAQALVLDGEENAGNIDISSPELHKIEITILGKGAHAGLEPEKGINALTIAADALMQLPLGRIDEETTSNIGLISGGTVVNAVPEKIHMIGEIRSRNKEKLYYHVQNMQKVVENTVKKYAGAKTIITTTAMISSYQHSPESQLIKNVASVMESLGIIPHVRHTGTGTDANVFNKQGIEAVAISAGDYNPHTTKEYVRISEMYKAALFCEQFIKTYR